MKMTLGLSVLSAVALIFVVSASPASAQARRATTRPSGPGAGQSSSAGKDAVTLKKLEAIGPNAKVKTPDFKSDVAETVYQFRDWARISIPYETEPEWIDELEFRYMVLVKHPKTEALTIFTTTVTYIDVAKGKRHVSTVFLRPGTLDRYGAVEWAGVKVYIKGKDAPVAMTQFPDDQRPWTAAIPAREGVLLNRAQTPFALVAIDNYETIKPK